MIDALVDLCIDLTGRIAVVQAQRCQILAERAANFRRLIFVGPFSRRLCPRLLGDRRKGIQGILVPVNPDGKIAECERVAVANAALPVTNHPADLIGDLDQGVGVFGGFRPVGRHINAARIHHRGIYQTVNALDVPAAVIGGFEFIGECRMVAGVRNSDHGQRNGRGRHQCENRIEPGGNRKLWQIHR
jgi:hypothetical protein